MITWFDNVTCDNCGDRPVAHVLIMRTMLPNFDPYVIGSFNVCEKDDCAISLHGEMKSKMDFTGSEQFVWYHEDEDVRSLNWVSSQI